MRFVGVSLDCADPDELAAFYVGLLDGRLLWSSAGSAGVQVEGAVLVMQRVADYRPPRWPGESIVHLDLTAGDSLDEPEQRAIALGAQRVEPQPDTRWRVLLDPAGHPFLHHHAHAAAGNAQSLARVMRPAAAGRACALCSRAVLRVRSGQGYDSSGLNGVGHANHSNTVAT